MENIEIKKESVEEIRESETHICYTKIQRKDLSRFPGKKWRSLDIFAGGLLKTDG